MKFISRQQLQVKYWITRIPIALTILKESLGFRLTSCC